MEFTHYIILFAILLIVGGLFCIGWFQSTRGETEISPNGKPIDLWGMIFYPLNKFLCKTEDKIVFYEGEQLACLFEKMKRNFPAWSEMFDNARISRYGKCIDAKKTHIGMWANHLYDLEKEYDVCTSIDSDGVIKVWKVYKVHKFSPYIFKPIVGCYKCYASFWGTIIYWLGVALATYTDYVEQDFDILVPMWVVYCMSLVTVNCMIEKITK